MDYPKRVMKASELAAFTGQKKEYFSRLFYFPGQRFAWKASHARNSPVMIDTEEYEKWRQRQVKLGRRQNMIHTEEGMITLEGNQHDLIADYGVIALALIVDGEIPIENLQYVLDQASNIAEVYKTEGREAAEEYLAERAGNEQE